MAMHDVELAYAADGLDMQGRLYLPDSREPQPGILVFPEVFGISEHSRERARRLADLGYVALAADLHGGARLITNPEEGMGLGRELRANPDRIRARATAALDALRARPEVQGCGIAAIGFCFGGTMALELARSGADLRAVIGFHSGLASQKPAGPGAIKARILVCIGADDPSITAEQRNAFEDEMRRAGAVWGMQIYGNVVHSFTNVHADRMGRPELARYDAEADRLSWLAMRDLLEQTLR